MSYITLNKNVDEEFIKYLIRIIKIYGLSHLDKRRLDAWTEYLNSVYDTGSNRKLNARDIIVAGFSNITYVSFPSSYSIQIDETKKLPYTTNILLYKICNMINSGTLDMKGYPIFDNAYNYIVNNIRVIKLKYELGLPI